MKSRILFILIILFCMYISLYTHYRYNMEIRQKNWMFFISQEEVEQKYNESKHSIDMVIARYNEPLDWLYKINTDNINVICYNKNDTDFYHPKVDKVINLPNIGKCDHTFLYHIINNYNCLSDMTIFTVGSCDMTYKWGQFLSIFYNAKMYNKSVFWTVKYNDIKSELYDFTLENYQTSDPININKNKEMKTQLCSIRPFGKWYENKFGNLKIREVNYRAIFAVNKNDIRNRPKEFYENLILDVMTSNPECGHFIERSWLAIFNK